MLKCKSQNHFLLNQTERTQWPPGPMFPSKKWYFQRLRHVYSLPQTRRECVGQWYPRNAGIVHKTKSGEQGEKDMVGKGYSRALWNAVKGWAWAGHPAKHALNLAFMSLTGSQNVRVFSKRKADLSSDLFFSNLSPKELETRRHQSARDLQDRDLKTSVMLTY